MERLHLAARIIISSVILATILGCDETAHNISRLRDGSPWVRVDAARELGAIGDANAIGPLIAALEDENGDVRKAAAEALGEIGDERAAEGLIKLFIDQRLDVRETAVAALAGIGPPASGPLSKALKDQHVTIRKNAAEILGKIGDKGATEPLVAALEDEDAGVRAAAAEALDALMWKPRTKEEEVTYLVASRRWDELIKFGQLAVEPLVRVVGDKKSYVREYALATLSKLEWKPRTQKEEVSYLIAKKRWAALVDIGQPAVEPLIHALDYEDWTASELDYEDRTACEHAVETLAEIGGERTVGFFIKTLGGYYPGMQKASAKALGQIGDPAAVDPLIKALADSYCREDAAEALGQIGDARAVEPLIEIIEVSPLPADLYIAAARALGKIGDPRAIEPLRKAMFEKKCWECNYHAAQALSNLNWKPQTQQESILYLIYLRNGTELAKIGPGAVEPLLERLNDDRYYAVEFAVETLGKIGDRRAVEPLAAVLSNRYFDFGPQLASALTELNWRPATAEEVTKFRVANRHRGPLSENWELTRSVLLADLRSNDRQRVKNAAYALIGIGHYDAEVVKELSKALDRAGTEEMARRFLNCGLDELETAAKNWAKRLGYRVIRTPGSGSPYLRWGEL